jgi:hypothetical protein
MQIVLFEEGEQLHEWTDPIRLYAPKPTSPVWKHLERVRVIVHRDAKLLEMVRAFRPPRCLARRLDGRQQQSHQYSNDGDDD